MHWIDSGVSGVKDGLEKGSEEALCAHNTQPSTALVWPWVAVGIRHVVQRLVGSEDAACVLVLAVLKAIEEAKLRSKSEDTIQVSLSSLGLCHLEALLPRQGSYCAVLL